MNEQGRSLLVYGIVYIAGFPEDRPITHAPQRALLRSGADRVVAKKNPDKSYVEWYFTPAVRQQGKSEDWPAFQDWYRKNRDLLRADRQQGGSLVLDEEAKAFGAPPSHREFFPAAIAALKAGGSKAKQAASLLRRYAPLGPKEMRPKPGNSGGMITKRMCFSASRVGIAGTSIRWRCDAAYRLPNSEAPRGLHPPESEALKSREAIDSRTRIKRRVPVRG